MKEILSQLSIDSEELAQDISEYLVLLKPGMDSPMNPRSHWKLLALGHTYGARPVKMILDIYFEEYPNW